MKKLLVIVSLVLVIAGCGLVPDAEGIKQLIEEDLIVTVEPLDEGEGVSIKLEGFPDELPRGLKGISIYLDTFDMSGIAEEENLGEKIASGISSDTTITYKGLVNGKEYFVEGRGEMSGDEITSYGFGHRFYPRPGGYGDYLGYDPGTTQPEDGLNNALTFDPATGVPTSGAANNTVDFFFFATGGNLYMTNAKALGGTVKNGIMAAGSPAEDWLEVLDATIGMDNYKDTVMIEEGQIYQFMLSQDYYGKFRVDSLAVSPALMGEGDAIKVWLKYAFQTEQNVGHY